MHVPVSRVCAHLFSLCCFLLLSSTRDAVSVSRLSGHAGKHKHRVNRQFAGGLWERICSCAQHKDLFQCFVYLDSSFGLCICFIYLQFSPPCASCKGHWHLMCLLLKHDSGIFIYSSIAPQAFMCF